MRTTVRGTAMRTLSRAIAIGVVTGAAALLALGTTQAATEFVDDNITASPDRAKELFEALLPLKVRWSSQASIDMVEDSELMDLMVDCNFGAVFLGIETPHGDRSILLWSRSGTASIAVDDITSLCPTAA